MSTATASTPPAVRSFSERHPFVVATAKETGKSFLVAAAIGFGLLAGARVATLGMKPVDSDNSAPAAE